jgi:type II secretory pathway pseudopilin PulG
MFCPGCGTRNPDFSAFCNKCGQTLSATTATPPGPPETDGKAVASLILGILSVTILWILAGIPAIIFGHISRSAIRKSAGRLKGQGMALAGLIMGYVSVAMIPIVLIIAAIAIPSLLRARQMANESSAMEQLREFNTAETSYMLKNGMYGNLDQLTSSGSMSGFWSLPVRGYVYSVTASDKDYQVTATPQSAATGRYGYTTASDGVIRYQKERTYQCNPCFPPREAGAPVP